MIGCHYSLYKPAKASQFYHLKEREKNHLTTKCPTVFWCKTKCPKLFLVSDIISFSKKVGTVCLPYVRDKGGKKEEDIKAYKNCLILVTRLTLFIFFVFLSNCLVQLFFYFSQLLWRIFK